MASPGPGAEPAQVVQALVDGVNARDADLVRELTTDGYGEALIETWFDGAYLTEAAVGETIFGGGQDDDASVLVGFVPEGTDLSIDDGEQTTWAFVLTEVSGEWRVHTAGQG